MSIVPELQAFLREAEPTATVKLVRGKEDSDHDYEVCWKIEGHLRHLGTIEVTREEDGSLRVTLDQGDAPRHLRSWDRKVHRLFGKLLRRVESGLQGIVKDVT